MNPPFRLETVNKLHTSWANVQKIEEHGENKAPFVPETLKLRAKLK